MTTTESVKTGISAKPRNLRPLQDRVLVRRDPVEVYFKGMILVPEIGQEKALKGTVLAVGPGQKWDDGSVLLPQVKQGDRVLFSGSVNMPYSDLVGEGDLIMMSEKDILGVLPE